MRGKFITLEGMDGAGKSSHVAWIADWLRARGHRVLVTREPGGTPLGEKLRELVLSEAMDLRTETLLVFAARQEHLIQRIQPALEAGDWVLSDRFTDATYAYQGGGRGLDPAVIGRLEDWVQGRFAAAQVARDRFEREDRAFFERVRRVYLTRAGEYPGRIHVIDAAQTLDKVKKSVENVLLNVC
jgi:dTMP kinase